jgi:putative FmdB family regulatory protein
MPAYDFRCNNCGEEFSLTFASIKAYETSPRICPNCQATDLDRIIRKVNVAAPSRDFTKLNSSEMLGVFESGDSKQVGQMFDQIGGTNPALGVQYHEATQRLLKGESMDTVESSLWAKETEATEALAKPEKKAKKKKLK